MRLIRSDIFAAVIRVVRPGKYGVAGKYVHGGLHAQAAGVIAGQRSALIGRVLPCLLALAEANGSSAVSPQSPAQSADKAGSGWDAFGSNVAVLDASMSARKDPASHVSASLAGDSRAGCLRVSR